MQMSRAGSVDTLLLESLSGIGSDVGNPGCQSQFFLSVHLGIIFKFGYLKRSSEFFFRGVCLFLAIVSNWNFHCH